MKTTSFRPLALIILLLLASLTSPDETAPAPTRFRGDLPLVVPVLIPDSVAAGSLFAQVALRLTDGSPYERGDTKPWSTTPLGTSLQLQWVGTPRLHLASGAAWGGSVSAWLGPVFAARTGPVRWELEVLGGATEGRASILEVETEEIDDFFGTSTVERVFVGGGDGWRGWGQLAARAQGTRGGPWLEVRTLPFFFLGEAVSAGHETRWVGWPVLALSAGWSQAIWKTMGTTAGARVVTVDGELPDLQLLAGIKTGF